MSQENLKVEWTFPTDEQDRTALARWIAALGDHGDWESLVPAVFGVSAAGFEAGWQAYLADHYDADGR